MHLKGSPKGDAKVQVHQGDQAKVPTLLYQVLLLGISAMERYVMKIFPEREKYILKVALSCFLCIFGIDLKGRQISGQKPPITSF